MAAIRSAPAAAEPRYPILERLKRWAPAAPASLLVIPVLFGLWVLRAETTLAPNFNDSSLHLAMVRWARHEIDQGRVPLDGWFPSLGMGISQFHHYQSLPHILTAYLSIITGPDRAFVWSLYLLLATFPISVYLGARLFGLDRWVAVAAAVASPILMSVTGYGFEHSSYTWWGFGLWSQLWGMWLLPLSLGLTWRAVEGRGSYALAALITALTLACHILTGYLALLAVGVWVLAAPADLPRRLGRAVLVSLGAVLAASWVIVPVLSDLKWTIASEYGRGTFFSDSFGAPKILQWLVTGQLYDSGRLPIVTVFVAVGLAVCAARSPRDRRGRAVVGLWLLSLLLLFGRPTLGPLLNLLPGNAFLQYHRFLTGVHLAGLMLAGIGAVSAGRLMLGLVRRFLPFVPVPAVAGLLVVLGVGVLFPAWTQVGARDELASSLKLQQIVQEYTDGADLKALIDRVRILGPGRVYAGSRGSWGDRYAIGFVPVYNVLANDDIDAIGFRIRVSSLMTDDEVRFDESNPAQYDLFNIRYLILPGDYQPPVRAVPLARQGRHTLWEVATSGYLDVVDTVGPPLVEDRTNVGSASAAFLESGQLASKRYPFVSFAGDPASLPTLGAGAMPTGPAGSVERQSSDPANGSFSATIVANRLAVVLLKASYDPRWRATVDGFAAPTEMVGPALMGRTVSPGRHTVTFEYVPYPHYLLLLGLGAFSLLALGLGRWRGRRIVAEADRYIAIMRAGALSWRRRRGQA